MDKKLCNLLKWSVNKKTPPLQIQIHFTNFCNLDCVFCPTKALVKDLDRRNELSEDELIRLVKEGNKLGVEEWHICGGGEPLYFKDTALKVMQLIKESGKVGELITNGTLITKDTCKKLVEMGWDKITLSLDSPIKQVNDHIRGKDSFDKVVNAAKAITQYKLELNNNKPSISFHMVVCNKNYTHIPLLIELAKKVGCTGVIINTLNIWSKETEKLRLNDKQIKELKSCLNAAKDKAEESKIDHNINDFSSLELFKNASRMKRVYTNRSKNSKQIFCSLCYMPWFNISIFPDGRTSPCFLLKGEWDKVKEKNLKEIWYGPYFNKIRKRLLQEGIKDECDRCNSYNVIDNERLYKCIQKCHQKNSRGIANRLITRFITKKLC
jgi:MoaA/NifB/PqqE/SkfB family radical SAM enzyme